MSMELLFAVIGGAGLAFAVRYLAPARETYGIAVLPAIGSAVTAIIWAALTWLQWPFDGGWIWVVSLLAAPLAALIVAIVLPRRRIKSDAALLESLSRA
ncbi:MAG: hypothetical protein JWP30_734 [Homoserinimonas sp.]|nr:hypothetical protein [Homoserinimonas sp.]